MENMKFKDLIGNKWFVLLINTVFFVLMAWLLPIHFEENDDATMCMIANGHYSGTPDGHLVFINAVYGWMIAGLYMITDAIEWYSLFFCIFHVLAMTIIILSLKKLEVALPLKILFIIFAYIYWIRIIIAFQFTTTAGLLCFAGCLALLHSSTSQGCFPSSRPNGDLAWRIVGLSSIVVASLIRFNAAALVGIMCLPMFINAFVLNHRFSYWLVVLLALVLCGKYADNLFYRSPDWAFYREYNAVRGTINDNPHNRGFSPEELPDGVSELDYELFIFFNADVNVMTLDRIKAISDKINTSLSIDSCLNSLKQLRLYLFPVLFVSIGLVACLIVSSRRRVYPLLALLLFFAILLYLGCFYSLKYRVFLCMLLPMMYQVLYWFNPDTKKVLVGIACAVVSLSFMGEVAKYVKQDVGLVKHVNGWNKNVIEKYVNPLCEGKDNWVICTTLGKLDYTPFIHPFHFHKLQNRFVTLSWNVAIPLNKGVLESHKDFIDSNILCFCPMKDFSGIVTETPDGIIEAIKKNYHIEVDTCIVDYNEKYALYRFVSK